MKGGLEGLSPLPKGPAPAPRDMEDPRPLPWARRPPGWGLAGWAEFCVLEKGVHSQSGGSRGLGLSVGGLCGEVPSPEPSTPRVGDKPSPYCSRMPPARCPRVHTCPCVQGRQRGESPKKQREREGPAGGLPCWRGAGRSGLKNHKNK